MADSIYDMRYCRRCGATNMAEPPDATSHRCMDSEWGAIGSWDDPLVLRLLEALEYAPQTAPVAPDLIGLWLSGRFVCRSCVSRITGRGLGHLIATHNQVWEPDSRPEVCVTCIALALTRRVPRG